MRYMIPGKVFNRDQAFQKIKHFCAYQERCHREVKDKLCSFGLRKPDVEATLSQLIEEDYLNEERFARQFAGGKFRMKKWGKVKITYELKQKQVSAYCIKKALEEISGEAYHESLQNLIRQKWEILKKEANPFLKKRKLMDWLLQKGYEASLVNSEMKNIDSGKDVETGSV